METHSHTARRIVNQSRDGAVWLYTDSADGKVKIKESDGTVHALW